MIEQTELSDFRRETRGWLEANYPAALRADPMAYQRAVGGEPLGADAKAWKQAIAARSWGAPTWPRAYGGAELSPQHARVLQQEMDRIGAYNPMASMGLAMFGPTLLEFGTDDQKLRHLPGIARGEVRWCQGYSEPGAGSDLASLQTRCEDAGDHWLVNGQKIWTSGAQWADWCFCLVRTDRSRKHEGISFVLINMRQPGVEARPIRLIDGASPFCETFFTDARAEKDDMVGPLNGGWTIGKRLLQHERSGQGGSRMIGGVPVSVLARRAMGLDESGRLADPDLRTRIVRHEMDARAQTLTLERARAEAKGGASPSAATSVMKNSGTWIGQERAELLIEILGFQGLGWEGPSFSDEDLESVRHWLYGKAWTIYGGSQEVQSNIIAKRILGLPESTPGA